MRGLGAALVRPGAVAVLVRVRAWWPGAGLVAGLVRAWLRAWRGPGAGLVQPWCGLARLRPWCGCGPGGLVRAWLRAWLLFP